METECFRVVVSTYEVGRGQAILDMREFPSYPEAMRFLGLTAKGADSPFADHGRLDDGRSYTIRKRDHAPDNAALGPILKNYKKLPPMNCESGRTVFPDGSCRVFISWGEGDYEWQFFDEGGHQIARDAWASALGEGPSAWAKDWIRRLENGECLADLVKEKRNQEEDAENLWKIWCSLARVKQLRKMADDMLEMADADEKEALPAADEAIKAFREKHRYPDASASFRLLTEKIKEE